MPVPCDGFGFDERKSSWSNSYNLGELNLKLRALRCSAGCYSGCAQCEDSFGSEWPLGWARGGEKQWNLWILSNVALTDLGFTAFQTIIYEDFKPPWISKIND